jgi:hypothetical protein
MSDPFTLSMCLEEEERARERERKFIRGAEVRRSR